MAVWAARCLCLPPAPPPTGLRKSDDLSRATNLNRLAGAPYEGRAGVADWALKGRADKEINER